MGTMCSVACIDKLLKIHIQITIIIQYNMGACYSFVMGKFDLIFVENMKNYQIRYKDRCVCLQFTRVRNNEKERKNFEKIYYGLRKKTTKTKQFIFPWAHFTILKHTNTHTIKHLNATLLHTGFSLSNIKRE